MEVYLVKICHEICKSCGVLGLHPGSSLRVAVFAFKCET
jgi:hypothetical protein